MALGRRAVEGLVTARSSLIIGASGQVGEQLFDALPGSIGTCRSHPRPGLISLDITNTDEFDRVLGRHRPSVIYLAAYAANVDYCETHADSTYKTNVGGVCNAVMLANRYRCKVVFLSSEYVFDGTAGPYDELAAPKPLSVYGWQKLAGEHYIAAFAKDWLIVRTTVVYSWESQGKNFLYRLRASLTRGERINVPVDQFSSPTYAPDLATTMAELVERGERGVFNVAGPRVVNRYEFALAAAQAFDLDPGLIMPVATSDLQQPAPRPLNAGLIVSKIETTLGRPMVDFSIGLAEMAATASGS